MRRALPAALAVCLAAALARAEAPNPSQFLKLSVGADRTLADYGQITSYFRALAAASPGCRWRSSARPRTASR